MLILTRRPGESIQVGNEITLTVTRIIEHKDSSAVSVRIGIDAPTHITILRQEVQETDQEQ